MQPSHPALPPGRDLLAGKVVVITAAAGTGIGGAAATRCLDEGASLAISDAHPRRLAESHDEFAGRYGADRVWSAPCDVTSEEQVQALIDGAVGRFGRIDVMINNAGLGGTASVLEMTDEHWSRVLDVTLNGTFRCTGAALRQPLPRVTAVPLSTTPRCSDGAPNLARRTTPRPRPASWR